MSHHIYTTTGFVIESHPYGEAGKFISIFTRELGMVQAVAQGIRLGTSKLRYHAQDFSLATFSLVRGKEVWRMVGAQEASAVASSFPEMKDKMGKEAFALHTRILKVLRRLVSGEEKHVELFDVIMAMDAFLLSRTPSPSTSHHIASCEYIVMLRILHALGYIRESLELEPFLLDNSFTLELLEKMLRIKSLAAKEINTALKESHL